MTLRRNKYIIYDTHAHYDDNSFDEDRESVLNELKSNGVALILNCASSYESIEKTYNFDFEEQIDDDEVVADEEIETYLAIDDKLIPLKASILP